MWRLFLTCFCGYLSFYMYVHVVEKSLTNRSKRCIFVYACVCVYYNMVTVIGEKKCGLGVKNNYLNGWGCASAQCYST